MAFLFDFLSFGSIFGSLIPTNSGIGTVFNDIFNPIGAITTAINPIQQPDYSKYIIEAVEIIMVSGISLVVINILTTKKIKIKI